MNKLGVAFIVCASLLIILLPHIFKSTYSSSANVSAVVLSATSTSPVVTHVSTPNQVKAIYITACVAGTPSWRESLKQLVSTTELNSVVIDVKDYTGTISFIDPKL